MTTTTETETETETNPGDQTQVEHWYFTFGVGHKLISVLEDSPTLTDYSQKGIPLGYRFVHATGTRDEARDKMMARFGNAWAFQYSMEDFTEIRNRDRYRELVNLG